MILYLGVDTRTEQVVLQVVRGPSRCQRRPPSCQRPQEFAATLIHHQGTVFNFNFIVIFCINKLT
jgi:hypothetical protein